MTREEVLALCRKARDVGAVKHEDFADYIVVLESRRKIGDEWQAVEHAYMAVDGKLAMANEDHRKQGKRLDFHEPKVLLDNPEQLTLQVTVTSEIYGTRHGIATSRKKGGTNAERDFPWEVAETSAMGRALAAMGYGLLPGAGLASAEDIVRATSAPSPDKERASRRAPLMSANQRTKLLELYRERHGGTEAEALQGLDALFVSTFKHPLNTATMEEASKIIGQLIAQKVERAKKTT
jgi:hypothetical protein